MVAFATIAQYDARFPGRTASDEMLDECLDDATAAICAELDARGIDYSEPSPDLDDRLMRVCRSVANRIMPSGAEVPVGVSQTSMTAGPYSQQVVYTPSYGTPKLLPSEIRMLGIGGGRIGFAQPHREGDDDQGR